MIRHTCKTLLIGIFSVYFSAGFAGAHDTMLIPNLTPGKPNWKYPQTLRFDEDLSALARKMIADAKAQIAELKQTKVKLLQIESKPNSPEVRSINNQLATLQHLLAELRKIQSRTRQPKSSQGERPSEKPASMFRLLDSRSAALRS